MYMNILLYEFCFLNVFNLVDRKMVDVKFLEYLILKVIIELIVVFLN